MRSQTYWKKRSLERLILSERIGQNALLLLNDIYFEALKLINKDIQSIYNNYSKNGILNVGELKKALTPIERRRFITFLRKKAIQLGIDFDKIYDERYLSRLTRLVALQEQLKIEIGLLKKPSQNILTKVFQQVIQKSYIELNKDLALQGLSPVFSTLDKKVTNEILREKWKGDNYSSRIWKNTDDFADKLAKTIGSSLTSGQSYEKTSRLVRERFGVNKSNATRLVRTETNHLHNRVEQQSYIDNNIQEYEFLAHLDGRTSHVCRSLNRKKFKTKNIEEGVNYPAMHPYCRSTTIAIID